MKKRFTWRSLLLLGLFLAINVVAIGGLIYWVKETNSDKSPLLILFLYPLVLIFDFIYWVIVKKLDGNCALIIGKLLLWMGIGFFPLLYASIMLW